MSPTISEPGPGPWRFCREDLDRETLRWHAMVTAERTLSFADVAAAWRSSRRFRSFWTSSLSSVRFDAYCWECPPLTEATLDTPFECVFVASPSLARAGADREAFKEHFRPGCDTVAFANLGGDAILVAPCPEASGNFAHLASFTATASAARQDALWRAVGKALVAGIGPRPLWLNTAGHGVPWLHVRLDSRPKYYRHVPYSER